MVKLNEVLRPVYQKLLVNTDEDSKRLVGYLERIIDKRLLIPLYVFGSRVYFIHNNKVDSAFIEGYEITQTRDIQTIMYCFQDQDFNKIEEDLFETREALIDSLK